MTRWPSSEEKEAARLLEVASRQYFKILNGAVEIDELRSLGAPGATLALQRWDGRGYFGNFALQRIRWAILDGIRRYARRAESIEARDNLSALVATERAADAADLAENPGDEREPPNVDSLLNDAVLGYEAEVLATQPAGDGPEQIERDAERIRVRRAIASLPMVQRIVMERYCYGCETFEEVGEALGITRSAVFDAYGRALRRLQKRFDPEGGPSEEKMT